ncbi:MAG TPA: peptidylprolyl isomerase [Bacteroidales bacterium]|nr:peptidylprolyl isomerase [Bacteroidales bacterium]
MKNHHLKYLTILASFFITMAASAQPKMIDRVVAIVGDYTILQSDIESQYLQMRAQRVPIPDLKCYIFKSFLEQKLMLDQAKIDSIEVSESTVDAELNNRMQYFINQIGGQDELEAYFGKTILEIKEDFRQSMRDQLITQQMESKITGDIKVTPSEVRRFYNDLDPDSIPTIDAQVEIQQIVAYPSLSEDAIFEVKEKLLELRKRIMEGESFETLAVLYSQGPSAAEGGDIGWSSRGELDPAYAKAAFALKVGGISKIVKSDFGYHIIQLIGRKDDRVHTRHILMKPKVTPDAREKAISRLDSIITFVRKDSTSFENAARYYSQDKNTAMNDGLVVNPQTGSSKFELKQLDTKEYLVVRDLKVGEISDPYEATDENGKTLYKVVRLKSRTNPHKANLDQDYILIQNMALAKKRQDIIEDWIKTKQDDTYIHIDDSFKDCDFIKNGWLKTTD